MGNTHKISLSLGRVAVANYEVPITSDVSLVPFGDDVALFGVTNQVWHGKRDTRLSGVAFWYSVRCEQHVTASGT